MSAPATTRRPRLLQVFLASALLACAPFAAAEHWQIDEAASSLGFVSVKNGAIVEGHRFTSLSGGVVGDTASLSVDLASVDTAIEIRDERMRTMLFEVAEFPMAQVDIEIDGAAIEALAVGATLETQVSGTLSLHGVEAPISAAVVATRTAADAVTVASARPVVIAAAPFGLGEGIERLRAVAGLAAITPSVPVSFSLRFTRAAAH